MHRSILPRFSWIIVEYYSSIGFECLKKVPLFSNCQAVLIAIEVLRLRQKKRNEIESERERKLRLGIGIG
jgi:hypothetical protein